jgi:hypothetical protein
MDDQKVDEELSLGENSFPKELDSISIRYINSRGGIEKWVTGARWVQRILSTGSYPS